MTKKYGIDLDERETQIMETWLAAGHTPVTDTYYGSSEPHIDMFAFDADFCHGPQCSVCRDCFCIHCRNKTEEIEVQEPCPGKPWWSK